MSSSAPTIAAIDRGTATTAVSLLARAAGRWRLVGTTAGPAGIDPDVLLARLRRRVRAADAALADELGIADSAPGRVLACRTIEPPVIVVLAATQRVLRPLAAVAATSGWRVRPVATAEAGPLETTRLLADPAISAVLAGASAPPGADERSLLPDLIERVVAATQRRPELAVVLAGGLGDPGSPAVERLGRDRPGVTMLAAAEGRTTPFGDSLDRVLDELRDLGGDDGRRAIVRTIATLAEVLDRRTELVEVGASAGCRVIAAPATSSDSPARAAIVPDAALVPGDVDEALVDAVLAWLAIPMDQLRLRDRLRELALAPWADLPGDGALLRAAVGRAALTRLAAATQDLVVSTASGPELVVVAGGVWQVIPAPVVGLAVADVIRRPGAVAVGFDHARLLGPLGTVQDDGERGRLVADLRDELLLPLGSVLTPAGLRAGRGVGRLVVHGSEPPTELDLVPGGLELVDLPPGERAIVELRFRDAVDLGMDGNRFAVEVTGGLGGLLVDLRGVPLALPDRLDRRRDLLAAWQSALWPGLDA